MLKFIKGHLTSIQDVDIYPVIGFVLFFAMFLGVLWWVATAGKHAFDHMKQLPLNEQDN